MLVEFKKGDDLDIAQAVKLHLSRGAHKTAEQGACGMEWLAWVAGEPHSDHPQCASPVIGAFVRRLNDHLPDAERQQLIPLLLDCVGTRTGLADDRTRACLCADWAVRVAAPFALRRRGQEAAARKLEACDPVVDVASARRAQAAAHAAHAALAAHAAAAAHAALAAPAATAAIASAAYAAATAATAATTAILPSALDLIRRMCAVGRVPVVCAAERVRVMQEAAP